VHLGYNAAVEAHRTDAAVRAWEDTPMTDLKSDHETGDEVLGRRAVLRAGLAGGLAFAAVALEAAFSGVEAKSKPVKKKAKPKKSAKVKAAGTSTGSNGSNSGNDTNGTPTNGGNNTGDSNTGSNGTGQNAPNGGSNTGDSHTGANAGIDTIGPNDSQPPVTGPDDKQPTVKCTTKGDVVIAGPAGSPPTIIPGGKTCTTTP
jgi:hypothetical protein